MNSIPFKELIRKVHPDHNPDVKDSSSKVTLVMLHKDNPAYLYRLAVQWGIVTETNKSTGKPIRTAWHGGGTGWASNIVLEAGTEIRFTKGRKGNRTYHKAIVVDVWKNKGKKGGHNVKMVNLRDDSIFVSRVQNLKKPVYLRILGKATKADFDKANTTIYNKRLQERNNKAWVDNSRERRARNELSPNTEYNDGTRVGVKTLWGLHKVTRTTAKRVYFQFGDIEKYASFSSITNVLRD